MRAAVIHGSLAGTEAPGIEPGVRPAVVADKNHQEGFAKVVNPRTFIPENDIQTAALEVWSRLEIDNPLAFQTTYLFWAKKGLPVPLIYQFNSEIKQDKSIEKPGAVFNKKAEVYFLNKELDKCPMID